MIILIYFNYYNYIQKFYENNYIILLDEDFKIHGISEINNFFSFFNINNEISSVIIGCHIGLIIPNILMLLEYRNEEFNISKKDCELKGYLYPISQTNNLKIILENILTKIKTKSDDKNNINELNKVFNEDSKNIMGEFNQLLEEYNIQQVLPISIFYKIKLISFLNGKYKYYKVYIYNDISINEFNTLLVNDNFEQN